MSAIGNAVDLPQVNFKEKVRCGEVYRNLNGNEMFQKFYYRCLECSLDFESSPEFEEHVIVHYLQDDEDYATIDNLKNNENVISISSDEEENGYLYAFEVASLVEENVSENDLPLPLMQMLSEQSTDSCDQTTTHLNSGSDEEDEKQFAFACEGLRRQALHQYSEHCCTQCPAYFDTKSELDCHLYIHTRPNTAVCPHCYEAFPNVLKLNEHTSLIKRKKPRLNKDKVTEIVHNNKRAKTQSQEREKESTDIQHTKENNHRIKSDEKRTDLSDHCSSNNLQNSENELVETTSFSNPSDTKCSKVLLKDT